MGCWNGTCFLSNISILAGDRVKLQLLMPTCSSLSEFVDLNEYDENQDPRDINGVTYVGDNYFPFAPVITGEYNDYGSIEKIESDAKLDFFKKYLKHLVKNQKIASLQTVDKWLSRNRESKTPKKGIDATIPVKTDDIEKFIDMVERGSIIVKTPNGGWVRLRFVMMHENIYNSSIQSMSKWKSWQGENIFKLQENKKKKISDFYVKGIIPFNEDGEPMVKETDSNPVLVKMLAHETLWQDFSYSENRIWYKSFLIDFCENTKDEETVNKVISLAYDNINMNNYLCALRKPWALTGGAGSQDDNQKEIATHNKLISKFLGSRKEELKARYGE